jgi:glycerol-3-phosphate dehydrogenase (NAD(P)+)
MDLTSTFNRNMVVGVVGSGSFGLALANLLAENRDVILYSRRAEVADAINTNHEIYGKRLSERITATSDITEVTANCTVIFPVVSSLGFRQVIRSMAPTLRPDHIIIHGTKGLDIKYPVQDLTATSTLSRSQISTMSEIVLQESVVKRVGCMGGPNLASEIMQGLPAATVVASRFDEVINEGQKALRSRRFQVYGSFDVTGIEIAGVLKNVIAIASGALTGLGLGDNARALLISRGMAEMIYIGKTMGADTRAFIGLAGVGDLIATSASPLSRNYTVGYRLAKGEKLEDITKTMTEAAEGINTIKVAKALVNNYKVRAPITEALFRIMYGDMDIKQALQYLMEYPLNHDVDYL